MAEDPQMPVTEEMLHAFVDGELSPADMDRVEAWLNENPEKAAEVADWADQNAAIQALFPAPEARPAPAATPPANQNRAPSGLSWGAIAAALAMLGVGLAGGWLARGNQTDPAVMASLIAQATQAHAVYSVDPHRAVEVKASEEETLIRWLSNRVGEPLQAPDLSAQGFTLQGGRLLSVSEGPAAQFLYENEAGNRITLFAVKGATGQLASFTFNESEGGNSFYWEDENLTYAIVGDVARDALNSLAIRVFDQLP